MDFNIIARSAFPSGSEEKLMSFSFFFFFANIVDFCRKDLEGVSRLLSTGSLSLGFGAIQKVDRR